VMQNIVVLGVPDAKRAAFESAAAKVGVPLAGSAFRRGVLACTGSEFCKLAIVETKAFSLGVIPELERRLPDFPQHVKIYVTGCPNACGQHWIADIGLQGVQVEENGQHVDGFDVFVGGALGAAPGFARRLGFRAASTRIPDALENLLRGYLATREEGEAFTGWTARVGDPHILEILRAN
jgi:sulfite reductase (ferredoxin)